MPFLTLITLLLIYQLAGELIVLEFDLPVPGPVIGMLLLLATLLIKSSIAHKMQHSAQQLLSHFSLLFIPAGVGVMVHFPRIEQEWLSIATALVISTLLGLLITAWIMLFIMRLMGSKKLS